MIFCDIGNTSCHFLDGEKSYKQDVKTFEPSSFKDQIYYVCVNALMKEKLKILSNWVDVSSFVDMRKYYPTMGIDRICAVEAVKNAVIVDAGSAITVDVVENGAFEGGFIYPGLQAMSKTYTNISPALAYSFNFECDLDIMPRNSQDAISYGYLKTLYLEVTSHKLPIILTGGDAEDFKKIFKDAKVDDKLIFSGMKKIIQKANIC